MSGYFYLFAAGGKVLSFDGRRWGAFCVFFAQWTLSGERKERHVEVFFKRKERGCGTGNLLPLFLKLNDYESYSTS